jgi:hypothetical protein
MPRAPSTCTSTPLAPPRFGAFDTPAAAAAATVAAISAAMDWRSPPNARATAFAYLGPSPQSALPCSSYPRPCTLSVWPSVCRRVGRFMSDSLKANIHAVMQLAGTDPYMLRL